MMNDESVFAYMYNEKGLKQNLIKWRKFPTKQKILRQIF